MSQSKFLIFIRHPESEKNIIPTFSGSQGDERLSEVGDQQTLVLKNGIRHFAAIAGVAPNDTLIVSSPFSRAATVAHHLSAAMSADLHIDDRLRPIDSGRVSGMQESQARLEAPEFMRMLELYRAGVVDSHKIGGYGENLSAFESRIGEVLEYIACVGKKLSVVIAHRSSITASLIKLARASLSYPSDYFGYIPLDLGRLSAIQVRDGESFVWLAVNQCPEEVCDRLVWQLSREEK